VLFIPIPGEIFAFCGARLDCAVVIERNLVILRGYPIRRIIFIHIAREQKALLLAVNHCSRGAHARVA